jgi:hypothetical protein
MPPRIASLRLRMTWEHHPQATDVGAACEGSAMMRRYVLGQVPFHHGHRPGGVGRSAAESRSYRHEVGAAGRRGERGEAGR